MIPVYLSMNHDLILIICIFFQIFQIHKNKSAKGLSIVSFELETIGYTIALAYCIHKDLPFSAFGEYIFLVIQCEHT